MKDTKNLRRKMKGSHSFKWCCYNAIPTSLLFLFGVQPMFISKWGPSKNAAKFINDVLLDWSLVHRIDMISRYLK